MSWLNTRNEMPILRPPDAEMRIQAAAGWFCPRRVRHGDPDVRGREFTQRGLRRGSERRWLADRHRPEFRTLGRRAVTSRQDRRACLLLLR
jgi:hypothetical protein